MVDNNTVTSGGLGRAAVGGLLFGPVGAVVGGITGGKKTKTTCKKISIKLTVTGKYSPSIDIDFMISENKTDSIVYGVAYKEAQGCLSKFEIICKTKDQQPASQVTGGADDILKVRGRHDPCIVPRAVPCVEAACAIALYDLILDR